MKHDCVEQDSPPFCGWYTLTVSRYTCGGWAEEFGIKFRARWSVVDSWFGLGSIDDCTAGLEVVDGHTTGIQDVTNAYGLGVRDFSIHSR